MSRITSLALWIALYLISGVLCSVNIDDCEMMPCQNGATCQDGIADYACSCPAPLPGGITWGGKNCSVVLEGCLNHSCQNEAKCVPKYEQEVHSYTCQCQPGFHGEDCSIPTTFSFTSTGYILYDTDISNTTDKSIKESPIHITVRFRTTLANMVLLYQGDEDSYLILEMYNGFLQIGFRNNKTSHVIKADHKVDDGHWYKAEVNLKSSLELILHHDGCDNGICKTTQTLDDRDESHKFLAPVYIGGLTQDSLMNNTMSKRNFTGCMEDLTINSRTLIPQNINHDESFDMVLGCNKTNWCQPNPCHHQSACVDQWTSFKCDCSRPYKGPTCLQEYHSGTFFHEGVHSFGIFSITQDIGSSFILSAFIRTLKQDGLLLRISNNETNKLAVYLKSGHIHVTVMSSKPVSFSENISNGKKNMVSLEFRGGLVTAYNDQSMETPHEVPSVSIEAQDTVLVGGLPPWENIGQWGGFFKGCLQDVRIDDKRLEFFTLDAEDDAVYLGSVSNVIKDCVSDDTCKSLPCKNDGVCDVTWNEFTCACSANFTGPTCEEPVWCQRRPCPEDSTCHDIPGGYTCLYNATFNEDSSVVFTPSNISSDVQLTSVILNFRTRDTNAILLQASKHLDHISIFIKDGKLVVLIQSGNSVEHVNFEGQIHVSDALWHKVAITMKDSTHVLPQWMISFDDGDNMTLQGNAASLSFLLEDTPIVLAENYTGCLGEVSIGGLYLPFADQKFPQKFMKKGLDLPVLGCKGADVCSGTPCLNSGQCVDQFNQFNCACAAGWEGQHCETNIDDCKTKPCINGLCVDLVADYRCDCHSGYTGRDCETNVDDCQGHQCLNGGTCLDGVDSYKCHCPANFTGEFCQWPYPPERCGEQVICLNGGKCYGGIWGANCTCRPGFKGSRCEMNIDECESSPCLNGGTCQDSVNNFKCICNSSFTGVRCEKPRLIRKAQASTLVGSAIGTGMLFILLLAIAVVLITMRKKRATQGTYSPSRQEKEGARVEMWNVLKLPPTERLI